MNLPGHKTKIVCTIGPASESPEIMEQMIRKGMNVARLNFSHGDFEGRRKTITNLRAAARAVGRRLTIMADLPGPKIRIGQLSREPLELIAGETIILTTDAAAGDTKSIPVSFSRLPAVVRPGATLYLNDGFIQFEVTQIRGTEVTCRVVVGGELRSRKGLNLPDLDLGISAFTQRDRECLKFALEQGVEAISQSFVESKADIIAVREAAQALGYDPFIIAKIERSRALKHLDEIIQEADGIMIARGDLGVEIPIEEIALVQKQIMRQAMIMGKPVITATQMLESMVKNRRPTRAEATDVANAILDGTDCVMLSEESAMGEYPVDAVDMLARIASTIEPHRFEFRVRENLEPKAELAKKSFTDLIAVSVKAVLEHVAPAAVFVPTRSGFTARIIARFRLPVWVVAVSSLEVTCQQLQFSYGIHPVNETDHPENWNRYISEWLRTYQVEGSVAVLTEGPSSKHPDANQRMEVIDLTGKD
jgi:pyruvate kinase